MGRFGDKTHLELLNHRENQGNSISHCSELNGAGLSSLRRLLSHFPRISYISLIGFKVLRDAKTEAHEIRIAVDYKHAHEFIQKTKLK